ncbi:MAG TPA: hypothetical protein VH796_00745 [Nitrososphaeraceae archaeon]
MIQVSGYAAQHAKGGLAAYTFERRNPRDYDVLIYSILWDLPF